MAWLYFGALTPPQSLPLLGDRLPLQHLLRTARERGPFTTPGRAGLDSRDALIRGPGGWEVVMGTGRARQAVQVNGAARARMALRHGDRLALTRFPDFLATFHDPPPAPPPAPAAAAFEQAIRDEP